MLGILGTLRLPGLTVPKPLTGRARVSSHIRTEHARTQSARNQLGNRSRLATKLGKLLDYHYVYLAVMLDGVRNEAISSIVALIKYFGAPASRVMISFDVIPNSRYSMLRGLAIFLLGLSTSLLLCSCHGAAIPGPEISAAEIAAQYRLGPGDHIRLAVFNQPNLSTDFTVDGVGNLSLPLIGQLKAEDQTTHQLEQAIAQQLVDRGFLVNPSVAIQVIDFRPYYILGEINSPGSFPYIANLTIYKAVAAAHGYTYRADVHRVYIQRSRETTEKLYKVTPGTAVLPGDTIRIPERRF
jgi:protein involved in polysaccharide export with SLBB domain